MGKQKKNKPVKNVSKVAGARSLKLKNKAKVVNIQLKKEMDPTQDDMKDIECPVCLEYMTPPILQCENGHGTCSDCRAKLSECPVCKGKLTDRRKYEAENFSRKSEHPCKFRANGCTQMNLLAWKKAHELQCIHRYRRCPFEMCGVQIDCKDVKDHLLKDHESSVREVPLNSTQQFTVHDVFSKYKYSDVHEAWVAGDDVFIFHFEEFNLTKPERCCVCCMYVGSPEEARKYKYKLTLNNVKKYLTTTYTAQCHSYLERFQNRYSANTWVYLPDKHVSGCIEEGGFITVELKISKIE